MQDIINADFYHADVKHYICHLNQIYPYVYYILNISLMTSIAHLKQLNNNFSPWFYLKTFYYKHVYSKI